jgi:pantothenate kinase type III
VAIKQKPITREEEEITKMISLRAQTISSEQTVLITDINIKKIKLEPKSKELKIDSVVAMVVTTMMTRMITEMITTIRDMVVDNKSKANTISNLINNYSGKGLDQAKIVDLLLRNHPLNFTLHQVERAVSNSFEK